MIPYILGTISAVALGVLHYNLVRSAYENGFQEAVNLFAESISTFKEEGKY